MAIVVSSASTIEIDRPRQKPWALVDPFQRAITYLRVSVTDRCDFRCVYCMAEHMTFLPKADLLSLEELDRLCSAFIAKGVTKLRLTGGEPQLGNAFRDECTAEAIKFLKTQQISLGQER